ncbi:hypothetical protein P152DRAFT_236681 [Eremomyces bilateralis CBS 781.70]|uniref:F-box domain-containing protein n=1 Tax=Eremomyces bilateralis CBS 781.70 TaxID=1392243 RepID=A0A6G1GA10_9PEZI|nr:uncharacterized protein P152DRAFT_236681 [Eremomyces bilateralis CBS 781.70]KAF1814873.1 hypothetical protein P152DRAFT_236681 [Eremomyces bilateralis CBS 781.70]
MAERLSWARYFLQHPFAIVEPVGRDDNSVAVAQRLPTELIHLIYNFLGSRDFDSARRTCQSWMRASLDPKLLLRALKLGGWLQECEYTMDRIAWEGFASGTTDFSLRVMSNLLALTELWNYPQRLPDGEPSVSEPRLFAPAAVMDFTGLVPGYEEDPMQVSSLIFRVSVCQKFLLVAHSSMIYVYELFECRFHILTTILCPRRVVDMSMDSTCQLYAIAALLEGRMGVVFDLDTRGWSLATKARLGFGVGDLSHWGDQRRPPSTSSLALYRLNAPPLGNNLPPNRDGDIPHDRWTLPLESIRVHSGLIVTDLEETHHSHYRLNRQISREWNMYSSGVPFEWEQDEWDGSFHQRNTSVPVERGPRTIFRDVFAQNEPPMSVGLCPHRRCVAFGSKNGVELHWPEGTTGEHLVRNFQLRVSSDFLHFIPSRPGYPRARRKVQLVPSQAHPDDYTTTERQNQVILAGVRTSLAALGVWGVFYSNPTSEPQISPIDHYHVVPLADGVHMLFTDACNTRLCLGVYGDHDTAGRPGILSRKLIFIPPNARASLPRIYTATRNPRAGVKIVAVYDNIIVQYSIPSDIYGYSLKEETSGLSEADRCHDLLHSWKSIFSPPGKISSPSDGLWPMYVYGIEVATMDHVVDVAIHNHANLCIWAFTRDGRASAWVFNPEKKLCDISRSCIGPDGDVDHEFAIDEDDDVIMKDIDNHDPVWSLDGISIDNYPQWDAMHVNFEGKLDEICQSVTGLQMEPEELILFGWGG